MRTSPSKTGILVCCNFTLLGHLHKCRHCDVTKQVFVSGSASHDSLPPWLGWCGQCWQWFQPQTPGASVVSSSCRSSHRRSWNHLHTPPSVCRWSNLQPETVTQWWARTKLRATQIKLTELTAQSTRERRGRGEKLWAWTLDTQYTVFNTAQLTRDKETGWLIA